MEGAGGVGLWDVGSEGEEKALVVLSREEMAC